MDNKGIMHDWEEKLQEMVREFVEGGYFQLSNVKHISLFLNNYSLYVGTDGKKVKFDVCTISLDFEVKMRLVYKDGEVKEGIGPFEKYIDLAISLLALNNLEVI